MIIIEIIQALFISDSKLNLKKIPSKLNLKKILSIFTLEKFSSKKENQMISTSWLQESSYSSP